MDTLELTSALASAESFTGVFAADTIQRGTRLPESYIVNCSPSSDGGSHWVAFYQESESQLEVFDSFGNPLDYYNKQLLKDLPESVVLLQQAQRLQQHSSTVCGQYCLFFILKRSLGISYKELIHLFTDNCAANDKMVCQFVNCYFKLQTPVSCKKFLQ
jgi:hypothetical protein